MSVEHFGCEEFEQVLEKVGNDLGLAYFEMDAGEGYKEKFIWASRLKQGEHVYWLALDQKVALEIRSGIGQNGESNGSGEDSIRVWTVRWNGDLRSLVTVSKSLGGKLSRYVTRVKGWEERLEKVIGQTNAMRLLSGDCSKCGEPLGVYKVKKAGANQGKLFAKCWEEGHDFKWMPSLAEISGTRYVAEE